MKRARFGGNTSNDSIIDIEKRVLFLSTNLVNQDPNYFSLIDTLEPAFVYKDLCKRFHILLPSQMEPPVRSGSLGVHIRQGDFQKINSDDGEYRSNVQIEIKYFIEAIEALIKTQIISSIVIFSDEGIDQPSIDKITSAVDQFGLNISVTFQTGEAADRALRKMFECEMLLIGNSTFSFWASVLKRMKTFHLFDEVPYNAGEHFPHMSKVNCLKQNF